MTHSFRNIFALALPSIIANITTPLLGMVDLAIVGHMGSAIFIAAIAVGGSMFNLIYWLLGFLRMGSSGLTAQAFGASDRKESDLVLWRALLIGIIVGLVFIVLKEPLADVILRFMDADMDTMRLSRHYFMICIWGAPAVLGTYALTGWFLGMQDSRIPMWTSFVINIANIVISLILVVGLHWKITGVAVGTLSAQWCGFLVGFVVCLKKFRPRFYGIDALLAWRELKRFFSVNSDIFLRTVCLVAVTIWFTHAGARQGAVMLAVNSLLMQLFMLFSYFMDGFAFAAESLCGRYKGAGDNLRLHMTVRDIFICSGSLAILFSLIYMGFGQELLLLLSDDRQVADLSKEFFWWVAGVPLLGFCAFTWDGVCIGVTETRKMLYSMVLSTAVFFMVYAVAYSRMSNHGLWLAFISYVAMRGIVLTRLMHTKV